MLVENKYLVKTITKFWQLIDVITALLMAFMLLFLFANVILRYGFSSGLRPAVELSRLSFVWVVMLGSISCLHRGEHLVLNEISKRLLPKFVLYYLQKMIWLVILLTTSMLFGGAMKQAIANWHNVSQLTGLPSSMFYIAGAVAGFFMMLIALVHLLGLKMLAEQEIL